MQPFSDKGLDDHVLILVGFIQKFLFLFLFPLTDRSLWIPLFIIKPIFFFIISRDKREMDQLSDELWKEIATMYSLPSSKGWAFTYGKYSFWIVKGEAVFKFWNVWWYCCFSLRLFTYIWYLIYIFFLLCVYIYIYIFLNTMNKKKILQGKIPTSSITWTSETSIC